MNLAHQWICSSRWWGQHLSGNLIPWALDGLFLGARTLELGPGPGMSSSSLQRMVGSLVCVEPRCAYAEHLSQRIGSETLRVLCADAVYLPLRTGSFDSVLAFTMLHHVSPGRAQDCLFAEAARVLRPGGVFAGTDSTGGTIFRLIHGRTAPQTVDPSGLVRRLREAGFATAEIERRNREFRFRAWR